MYGNNQHDVFSDIQERLNGFFIEIQCIYGLLNPALQQLQDLEKKHEAIDRLAPIKGKFEDLLIQVRNHFLVTEEKYTQIKSQVFSMENELKQLQNSVSELHGAFNAFQGLLSQQQESWEERFRILEQHCQGILDSHKQQTAHSLDVLKKDLHVSPKDVFSQNQEVLRALEAASLDGSNAMLRVNNHEMHMRILEKKIESLMIQLKKIELGQQL